MADSEKERELVAYVDELYSKGNHSRWMFLQQWLQNVFYLVGNQYIRWVGDLNNGHWETTPEVSGRIRYTINKILPAMRMVVGRMLKDDMQQVVIHATQDEQSIDAAKAATQFLNYLWRQTDGDRILKELAMWAVLTGIGITKTYIDIEKGPKNKAGKPDGEICVDVISPFEFVVPPTARCMEKMPWAMHARIETKEHVWDKWGVEVEGGMAPNEWSIYQAVNLNIMEQGAFFGTSTVQFSEDTVMVKELWIRPCKKYPNGRVIIVAGDKLVDEYDIPWDKNYWPFNWLSYGDVPFRFWPMSMVETMIDAQKAINLMGSMILENIRYMGLPVLISPLGAVDPDTLVAEAGAVYEYNAQMGKPEFVTPNPVPNAIFAEKQQLETEIYDLAGIHMLGSGMGGLRAAAAIMLMEQQDETAFKPIIENVKSFLKRDAELKLLLVQKGFTVKRKIKVLGEEGQWLVHEFDPTDLTGEEDIEIQTKEEFANDKATRFNQLLQLIQARDENDKPYLDRQTVLQLLRLEGLDVAASDDDLDYNRAEWENQQMLKGEEVAVNDFDDHAAHIKYHNRVRKRIDFEKLPKHVQDLFAQHVLAHQQMLQGQTPQQTEAKGDESVGMPKDEDQSQQQQGQPGPMAAGYNAASAIQSGMRNAQDLISMAQT